MLSESAAPQHIAADHILPLLHRLGLGWLLQHFPPRLVRSAYVFVNGFITIGLLALLARLSRNPFVFPSLGPTA
jgi:CBS domain-containing membrane protein